MSDRLELGVVELLAARLCHELIGPVAAIGNGVELLGEDDPEFVRDAAALVGSSARLAAGRLQFYRFAYGFRHGSGLTGPAPHELVAGLVGTTRVECDYRDGVRAMPLEWQKLACNLVALGVDALPRGGRLVVDCGPDGLYVDAAGEAVGLTVEMRAALSLATPVTELSARLVHAYFTGFIARQLGRRLTGMPGEGSGFRVIAREA